MEMTTVYYTTYGNTHEYEGPFVSRNVGVVLLLSPLSQVLIPWHNVIKIEQTFTESVPVHDRNNKSLSNRTTVR